ncbi:hypothetical protein B0H39_001987 [Clostridium beijerinckii]|uniref:Uncharacterized protein n=1 Tax=Clostridium diolis TaxID=223919 RepID=A0AAV3W513_9CLOT|nr:hypothetical protein [Clostridium beijerinckii]NOW84106.1 hypothetical protein [Clostridium beijerinckii]GEA32186.1 hypothetical protein CDIOL_31090 [Clostridium diolis]
MLYKFPNVEYDNLVFKIKEMIEKRIEKIKLSLKNEEMIL